MRDSTFRWTSTDTASSMNWRLSAACADVDPELMFPEITTSKNDRPRERSRSAVEVARAVCAGCPVVVECLAAAMAEEGNWMADRRHGVRGGLTGAERARLYRRQQASPRIEVAPPPPERTLQSIFAEHTVPDSDGHLAWTGPGHVWVNRTSYTPRRLAFLVDRDRQPDGAVTGDCGRSGCVLPAHVTDATERQRCGTTGGYSRHFRDGTPTCEPCRKAHREADQRLRHTGTTKVLA